MSEASNTNAAVKGLSEVSEKIGQVVELHWKAGPVPAPPVVLHDAPAVFS